MCSRRAIKAESDAQAIARRPGNSATCSSHGWAYTATGEGLTVREDGLLLGISHQRVKHLVDEAQGIVNIENAVIPG